MPDSICVFISYKREDQAVAESLSAMLERWGYATWLDVKDITSGISEFSESWKEAIHKGLKRSHVLIGLITPDSLTSRNVRQEWDWAYENSRRILLLRLRPFDKEEMPPAFIAADYIDLQKDESTAYARLQRELEAFGRDRDGVKATVTPPALDAKPTPLAIPPYLLATKKLPRRPVTWRLTLRFIGIIGAPISFLWLVTDISFEPLLAFLGAVASLLISSQGVLDEDDLIPSRELTEFQQMRQRVYQYWVQGVMQTALKEVESVGIGLDMQPEAVVRDTRKNVGDIKLPNDSRHVRQVYDTFKSFLILGAPGAGKTIMLLQLAESLILKPPPTMPDAIPLVLNLSSWALTRKPLHEWLEDETWRTYRVRGSRVRGWLSNNQLILLLDGLDEVKEEQRAACVEAINAFRTDKAYALVPLVVCSRILDYERLGEMKLALPGAIFLEALSELQVDHYLSDPNLAHLKRVVKSDPILKAMTTTPFLLNTMIYAYRHEAEDALRGFDTEATRREHLFTTYVQRRLKDNPSRYNYQDTIRYLQWLATKMQAYVQTVFRPEDITLEWIADDPQVETLRTVINVFGRSSLIQFILRLRLLQRDAMPLRLTPFLNAMTERQILRTMGGGTIFIHRYLLENFAGVDEIYVLLDQLKEDTRRDKATEALSRLMENAPETTGRILQTIQADADAEPDPVKRAAAYRNLYDTRPGIGLRPDGVPDIVWCEVPAGEFIYQEGQKLTLPAYQIAKYPITYRQFQAFIDSGEYDHPDWWRDLAAVEYNKQVKDQEFKFWNHPRDNVNWVQAVAFCRWLSVKLGYEVRLPTEFEWERAARGTDGLIFPYGNAFDAAKGNTRATGIEQTSAVGIFPSGASPVGALDMSGNVWEWCLSEYDNPALDAAHENMSSAAARVCRGGSWFYDEVGARAAYRLHDHPGERDLNLGFRVSLKDH